MGEYWWVPVVLGLVWLLTKGRRHKETSRANETKMVLDAVVSAVVERDGKNGAEEVILKAAGMTNEDTSKGLVGAVLQDLAARLENDEIREIPKPEGGQHELDALADAAVKSEEKREKIKRGLKTVGAVALRVIGSAL